MRMIDADEFVSQYKGDILTAQIDYAQGVRDVLDDIKNAPTIYAIPVVRCRECKKKENCKYPATWNWCPDGERKEKTDER